MNMLYLLQHLVRESAERNPCRTAIVCGNESATYEELERSSSRLAGGLRRNGVERGARIGIHMQRGILPVLSALGILKAGASYVPIDPLCPPARLAYIVRKCGIGTVLASQGKLENINAAFPEGGGPRIVAAMDSAGPVSRSCGGSQVIDGSELFAEESGPGSGPEGADVDLAYVLFTSGSTGNPKGVMLSHRNALTFIDSAQRHFGIGPEDRLSNICPLHFDMSVFDLFVAFKAGATAVVVPETAATFPVTLAGLIARERISVWNSVPSALTLLASYQGLSDHDLSALRLVLFAGERMPLKYLRRLREVVPGARFCNMYGQTEANSSTYYWIDRLPENDAEPLPVGKAMPNFDVFALDGEGRAIAGPGQEGELYVRASTVALGYWDEPERTAQAFVPNPLRPESGERVYRTGDLVRLDPEGNYVFLGRKDHMIKSRGYRIEIGEIESVLREHRDVKNAVVIPVPDEIIGNRIWAIVVPAGPGGLTREELLRHCARRLPKYMLPEVLEFRDGLPTTSSGKVDRQSLRAAGIGAGSAPVAH